MKIFAISDLHLSFNEHIDKPMDSFGLEWENHAERLRKNWKERITDDDLVFYHNGRLARFLHSIENPFAQV